MREQTRRAFLTGGLAGFLMAGTLALPSILPPAIADEEPIRTLLRTADQIFPEPLGEDTFAKPKWTIEPWVSKIVSPFLSGVVEPPGRSAI